MYGIMDKELFIRARGQDTQLVTKAAKEAAQEFQKNAGFAVETDIDRDSPLPPDRFHLFVRSKHSAGGVVLLGHGGKIEMDNTLEERLTLLESASLPKLRASIFGYLFSMRSNPRQSESRKFFD
jgi:V-type H+-transporting ATPase subunit E